MRDKEGASSKNETDALFALRLGEAALARCKSLFLLTMLIFQNEDMIRVRLKPRRGWARAYHLFGNAAREQRRAVRQPIPAKILPRNKLDCDPDHRRNR